MSSEDITSPAVPRLRGEVADREGRGRDAIAVVSPPYPAHVASQICSSSKSMAGLSGAGPSLLESVGNAGPSRQFIPPAEPEALRSSNDIVAGPLLIPEETGLIRTACPGQRSVSYSAMADILKPQAECVVRNWKVPTAGAGGGKHMEQK